MNDLRELGESVANAVVERVGRGLGHVQERKPLSYDLLESDDSYLVVFDAAGASKSDIQVRFVDTEIQVRIDRFRDFHDGFEMRFPGRGLSLNGKAKLPGDASVDAEAATATVTKHGTLRVYIPKTEGGKNVAVEEESETEAAETTGVDADAAGGETSVVEEQPTEEEAQEAATAHSAEEDGASGEEDTADEGEDAAAEGTDASASTESMLDEEATTDDPNARAEPAEAAGQPTDESMDELDDEFVEQAESRDEEDETRDEEDETRD